MPEPAVRSRLRRGREALAEQVAALAASPADADSTIDRLDDWAASIRLQLAGTPSPGG